MSDPRRTTNTYPVRSNSNTIEWVYDRTRLGSNEGLIMEVAMSALPAEELTCGSDIRPPRALRPVPAGDAAPSGPGGDTPAVPDDDTPAIRRDTPGTRRDTPGARSVRRSETPAP